MLAKKSELGREKSEISRIQNFSMTSTRMDKGLLKWVLPERMQRQMYYRNMFNCYGRLSQGLLQEPQLKIVNTYLNIQITEAIQKYVILAKLCGAGHKNRENCTVQS
jgi:hypothetical protein